MHTKNIGGKVGIWLDHEKAHFVDLSKGPAIVETVFSGQETHLRYNGESTNDTGLGGYRHTNNEHHAHNRQHDIMHRYYIAVADRLKQYDDIFILGPSGAKDELYNLMISDKAFAGKNIAVKAADKLTENQLIAMVKGYFNVL